MKKCLTLAATAKVSSQKCGRSDPSGLEHLSTATSSDPSGGSDVTSSLSSLQGDRARRVAEQLQAVRDLFEKQKTVDVVDMRKPKPAQPSSVDSSIPKSPKVAATIRYDRVAEVRQALQSMKRAQEEDVGPKTSPTATHQEEGHQTEPKVNPHVLPTYVSRLDF